MSQAGAQDHLAALYASEEQDYSMKPEDTREIRRVAISLSDVEWRKSRDGQSMTMSGHAAVFNRLSHDLGGFREKIDPEAFDDVLNGDPDVHLLWDHDTSLVLARTRNKTLDLRRDPVGLHFWGRVAPTSYASDLQILMERGDVDQASFAFIVGDDDWQMDENENVIRTIKRVSALFDVTITAQGAYPQTDANLRSLLQEAIAEGRLPNLSVGRALDLAAPEAEVAEVAETDSPEEILAETEETLAASDEERMVEEPDHALADLQLLTREDAQEHRESYLRLLKEHGLRLPPAA